MAAIDYLTLRSTLMYTAPGVLAPTGSIFTVGSSGMQALNTTVSTIGASTITVSTLFGSTLYGSTMVASGISLSTLTVSTINGALPGSGSGTALGSTMVSIGASTNQTYNNFLGGSFTTGWTSTLTGTTAIKKVVLSNNGATQTILQNSGSTMSTVITSLDSGLTWTGSTMRGLPTSGALPYQTYGSTINAMAVPSITAMTAAPSSGNQLAIASNDLVYTSANSGATFAPQGLGQNNNPFIYIPFDGSSVADVMGNATVTAYGSPAFPPGKVGTNAVNLVNTLNGTTPAAQYVRFPWVTAPPAFTVSFWFNSQTPVSTVSQLLFSSYNFSLYAAINTSGNLYTYFPTGSGSATSLITNGSTRIIANIWYNMVYVFQTNGTCSLYLNNFLIGSTTNSGGFGSFTSSGIFSIGCPDATLVGNSFNGYIDDFRVYNYAVTNPSGAALINPLVGPIAPYVYLTFDGSATADLMGNSTTTVTGSVGYVTGQVGSNAIFFGNAGTGVNPIQYVTGTVSGLGNTITVSFWFYTFVLPTSVQATVWSMNAVTSGGAIVQFSINTAGTASFQYYNGSAWQIVNSASAISLSTWYNAVCVYQAGSTCSLYLNGALTTITGSGSISPAIASYTLGGGQGTPATPNYGFYGVIDDFRIYNGAFLPSTLSPVLTSPSYAIGSPNIYLPFENGSVLDVLGYSAISARGTMNFVPGVVGSAALNLVNPAGGTVVNYLRGSWAGSPNFTVSFWFNAQSLGASSNQVIFAAYTGAYAVYINTSNQIMYYLPSGGTALNAITGPVISINTWYYVTAIFQTNGTCSLYVNNSLAGTYTNTGGVGSYTTAAFGIATYDALVVSAFNGYIDDFKLYNCAIPYNTLGPMNYTQAAMSNTGAYQVVAAANGGVYTSANNGSTWSQAATSPAVVSAVNTVGGQLITPNLTGLTSSGTALTTAPWTQNGVTWVASTSTVFSASYAVSNMFNNTLGVNNGWANSTNSYTSSGNTTSFTTVIQGVVPNATGEWIQIQSSVPLVMASYQFATGNSLTSRLPKTYYIVGSNDGSVWYPIQYGAGGTVTTTAVSTLVPGIIIVNSASTQTFGSSTITTTTYSTTTNAYTYFRIVFLSIYNATVEYVDFGEWFINFATPATPLYVVPFAGTTVGGQAITPNLTGLDLVTTWTQNGVNWVASSSSIWNSSTTATYAFNNTSTGNLTFGSNGTYTSVSGATNAGSPSTAVSGLSAQVGEWIQLQSSVPLVMNSYIFSCGVAINWQPKTYIIVGSNNGTTWYPIQSASFSGNAYSTASTSWQQSLIVNFSGAQTVTAQNTVTATTTIYSSTTNAYTYFRVIATSTNGGTGFELGEWFVNFTTPIVTRYVAPSTALIANQSLNAINVMPQQTGLASSTWTQNGISWVASASNSDTRYPYNAFNNITGTNGFYTGMFYNGNTGAYTSSVSTAISGLSTATGEWLQIQSSVPLVMSSYTFACTGWWQLAKTGFIVGSMDGMTWFPIQSFTMTTNPFTTNFTTASSYITIGPIGTQTQAVYGNQAGSGSFTGYATSSDAYTYFRFIASTISGASTAANAANNEHFAPSEWFVNFTAYTPSLLQSLTVSQTGQYMALTGTSATTPNLAGLATSTWTANGVSWTASASSVLSASYAGFAAFNNYYGTVTPYSWASVSSMYSTSSPYAYTGSTSTTVSIAGTPTAILGEWLQIQSSAPLVMSSYAFGAGGPANFPQKYYIIGSNDGSTWYPIQYVNITTTPSTTGYQLCSTYLTVSQSGIQSIQGGQMGSANTTSYNTTSNAYTYFRIITTNITGVGQLVEISEWYINFQSGPTFYSTNYGSSWTQALTAATLPNANVLATSGNDQYSLQGYGQTVTLVSNTFAGYNTGTYTTPMFTPALSASVGAVNCASISLTGQYMVILIQSTSNNVYYSTNYGVSFTGLTVGSSPMVSCAISVDGSYITVANMTQIYTLNRNTQGYSVAVGNQAGQINQAQNAIAIGNQAGQTNQSANSIILNANGSALNAYLSGFYVSPIANYTSSSASFFRILGYGSDSQVIQTGMTSSANGYVGIGTTNPTTPCTIYSSGTNTAYLSIYGPGTAGNTAGINISPWGGTLRPGGTATTIWALDDSAFSAHLLFGTAATGSPGSSTVTERMRITSAGNVGIGTATPGYALHVVGAIYATGDITCFSDQRYKQNIIRLDRSLDAIRSLSGYSYTREDYRPGEKQIGLLAQEVLTVFPEAISHDSTNDKYSVNYNCLIAPVVEAIKELYDRSEAQADIIKTQQSVMESQDKTIQLLLARLGP